MAPNSLDRKFSDLEAARYRFDPGSAAGVLRLLRRIAAARISDPRSLIRFHECLLFLRAFPQSPAVLRKSQSLLNHFWKRVEAVREAGAEMEVFDPFEVSGIAGTEMADTLSFDVARWLIRRLPGQVSIDWDAWDESRAMAAVWPRLMPLLGDDALVEADTPWRRWLQAAQGNKSLSPAWLIERFESLPVSAREQAQLYDSLHVPLRWKLGNSQVSRTRNLSSRANHRERSDQGEARGPAFVEQSSVFYQQVPLIARSVVSLACELAKGPPALTRLARREGQRVMDSIRDVMLVRYRELYGTTLGDPASVVRADLGSDERGRGVSIYLWSLPPDRRLPLRAYVAGFTWKNGVPINYIEAIALFEWMEVGFNTFYTFRGGEAGWIYAQVLRCLCHHMGTTCVSVYPYQLGHDNDEAIESGAFWFYRKLGFRPGRVDLLRLVEREERKIAADPNYRTPARTLRRLAQGHVFYDLPGSEPGAWDTFSTRNIGLRVNRHMAHEFEGDSRAMREACVQSVGGILGMNPTRLTQLERTNLEDLAVALALISDLRSWPRPDKRLLVEIIRAKSKPDEMLYLHLLQNHGRLREAMLGLGS